jgi:hypothetical protein
MAISATVIAFAATAVSATMLSMGNRRQRGGEADGKCNHRAILEYTRKSTRKTSGY